MAKYSEAGVLVWLSRPVGPGVRIASAVSLRSGGFILAGDISEGQDVASFRSASFLMKLDQGGREVWRKSLSTGTYSHPSFIRQVVEHASGDLIISHSKEEGFSVERVNLTNGALVWSRPVNRFGGFVQLVDDDVAVCYVDLQEGDPSMSNMDAHLMRISGGTGAVVWERAYRSPGNENVHGFKFDGDGFYILGTTFNAPEEPYWGRWDGFVIRTDLSGYSCE